MKFFTRSFQICYAAFQGFIEDNGFDKASTLTYYTLLALVPMVAIIFGIAQKLGFYDTALGWIQNEFSSQPVIAEKLTEFANAALTNTKGGLIAGFGIAILLWTVVTAFREIEFFFDQIWHVKNSRTLLQQIAIYAPIIFFLPIFFAISGTALSYVRNFLGPLLGGIMTLISYLISWIILTLFYKYIPNTSVRWTAAATASFLIGILYSIWQWIYVTFQVGASSYGAIYGSFAALPLFLIWLYYSWLILIFGSELSYHIQKNKS